jgi:hypothetical protein
MLSTHTKRRTALGKRRQGPTRPRSLTSKAAGGPGTNHDPEGISLWPRSSHARWADMTGRRMSRRARATRCARLAGSRRERQGSRDLGTRVLSRAAKPGLRPTARSAGLVGSGLAIDRLDREAQVEMPGLAEECLRSWHAGLAGTNGRRVSRRARATRCALTAGSRRVRREARSRRVPTETLSAEGTLPAEGCRPHQDGAPNARPVAAGRGKRLGVRLATRPPTALRLAAIYAS